MNFMIPTPCISVGLIIVILTMGLHSTTLIDLHKVAKFKFREILNLLYTLLPKAIAQITSQNILTETLHAHKFKAYMNSVD